MSGPNDMTGPDPHARARRFRIFADECELMPVMVCPDTKNREVQRSCRAEARLFLLAVARELEACPEISGALDVAAFVRAAARRRRTRDPRALFALLAAWLQENAE